MKFSIRIICTLLFLGFNAHTFADIEAQFIEGAPKDTFVIKNTGNCAINNATISIDLSSSYGNLLFDTTELGAGVEVYQPFEVTSGDITLATKNVVDDGDQQLSIVINSFTTGKNMSFTIDVDDQLTNSERGTTQVVGSEMEGATITLTTTDNISTTASFDKNNSAKIPFNC
jgi:hypothetical protein